MANYYTSAVGNDTTGTGSIALPFLTPSKACTVAGPGDTIFIRGNGGTYFFATEHSFKPVGNSTDLLIITNYPGEFPVFDGSPPGATGAHTGNANVLLVAAGSEYADIGGFTVQNNNESSSNRGRLLSISSAVSPSRANHITLRDILVTQGYKRGVGIAGDYITLDNVESSYSCLENDFGEVTFGGTGGWAAGISTVAMSDITAPTNITLTNCYSHHNRGEGYIIWDCDTATLTGCISENNYSVLFYLDESIHVIFDRCIAAFNDVAYRRTGRNADGFVWAAEAAGTPNMNWSPANVYDVTYKNCHSVGVRYDYHYYHAASNTALRNTYIDVFIYYGSGYSSIGLGLDDVDGAHTQPSGNILRNTILHGTLVVADAGGWTFDFCNCVGGIPGTGTWSNCISADPLYVGPDTSGDVSGLALQATSPCIGAGVDVAGITTDYYGVARKSPPDIGAQEYLAGGPAAPAGLLVWPVDGGAVVWWPPVVDAVAYHIYYRAGTTVTTANGIQLNDTVAPHQILGLTEWTDYAFIVTAVNSGGESAASPAFVTKPGLTNPLFFGIMLSTTNYPYNALVERSMPWRQSQGVALSTTTTQVQCAVANALGLRIFATVRWNGSAGVPDSGPIGAGEIATYKSQLATFCARYNPELISVLNEEPSSTFSTLTSIEYLEVLDATIEVCAPLGIKTTNGGVVWNGAALCYWDYLFNNVSPADSYAFADIAFDEPARTTLMTVTDESTLPSAYLTVIAKNKDFLDNVYKKVTDMDYMNVHVHWDNGIAVEQVFTWYAAQTGLQICCNEGNASTAGVTALSDLLNHIKTLPIAFWLQYSIDSSGSAAMQDTTTFLRATGVWYYEFMVQLENERTVGGVAATPGPGVVTVTWTPVPYATGYRVYYQLGLTVNRETAPYIDVSTNSAVIAITPPARYTFAVTSFTFGGEALFLSNLALSSSGSVPRIGTTGTVGTRHLILLTNPSGKQTKVLKAFQSATLVLNENEVSALSMVLPLSSALEVYDPRLFSEESRLYFFRAAAGSSVLQLEGNTGFFLRSIESYQDSDGHELISLEAESALSILRDTQIPYAEGNDYTMKLGPADDLAKALLRENRGALALDAARDISDYLSVALNTSKAQVLLKDGMSQRDLLSVIQELARESDELGTWMGFDIVEDDSIARTFRFETYTITSDIDHRFPSGKKPILFSPESGNIKSASLKVDYLDASTVVYAYGQAEGILRPSAQAIDTERVGLGPFGRRESGTNASDGNEIQNSANSELRKRRPRVIFEADISDSSQAIYGRDFKRGSLVTIEKNKRRVDCRLSQITIELGENGAGEKISIKARSIS